MSKRQSTQTWLFIFGIFYVLSIPKTITAQIVPDNTLPNNSEVETRGNNNIIGGGTSSGNNLFHSFESFSVPANATVFINNPQAIQNIFSRVTGSSISNIDGLIKANGSANLFLLNPNGILFGPNASLNLGGSFLATSADSIEFADGVDFSADPQINNPILTVSIPIGLEFDSNPGAITVQGTGNNLSLDPQSFQLLRDDRPAGLQVQQNQTLALVGGDIIIEGANLTSEMGRIELGSVAEGESVKVAQADSGWKLSYEDVQNFQDVRISQAASVDTSGEGGGDIQVQGRQVFVTDASALLANTLGEGSGGNIAVKASEIFEVSGISANNTFISLVSTGLELNSTGSGGSLTIDTERLTLADGALIISTTFGAGNAGNLDINAGKIEAIGATPIAPTTISASAQAGTGNGGNLTINTERLTLADGAQIGSSTFDAGDAGIIEIQAQEIELRGENRFNTEIDSGLFATAELGSTGNGGNLTVNTDRLKITDRARIGARSSGTGRAGNLNISSDRLDLNQGNITANSVGSGGGAINLQTSELIIQDNSAISTSIQGGAEGGGNIIISSEDLRISDRSLITAAANGSGNGGNVTISSDAILGINNSDIVANAVGGNGGNISITSDSILGVENSDIAANAVGGNGGNIDINSDYLLGFEVRSQLTPMSDITASSEFGLSGDITINSPETLADDEVLIATKKIDFNSTKDLIRQSCFQPYRSQSVGSLVFQGKAGLAENPNNYFDTLELLAPSNPVKPALSSENLPPTWELGDPVVEGNRIVVTPDGRQFLVAQSQLKDIEQQMCKIPENY